MMGKVHCTRSRSSPADWPIGLSGHTFTARACPVDMS